MTKSALSLHHVAFEDLGSFAPVLEAAGYDLTRIEAGVDDLPDPLGPDLVVVLGGPVSVTETGAHPCMAAEREWLVPRLAARRPTLGICLGAQLMAVAMGARVTPMRRKEIGFAPLTLTEAGRRSPLRSLDGVPVLHWHGEAFETPEGAEPLAATDACATQGFALGRNLLGLQFHPEAGLLPGFERWLIGHSVELAQAGLSAVDLRRAAERYGAPLRTAGQAMLRDWLEGLVA